MKRLAILLLALAPLPALAQSLDDTPRLKPAAAQGLAGSWALKVDGATVFRFDIEPNGEGWKGQWRRPSSFASNGDSFSRLSSETAEINSSASKTIGGWAELTFPDNRPHAVPDVFRFRLIGADRAEMIYVDTGLAPFTLVRVPAGTALGPFTAGKVYRRVSVESLGLPADTAQEEAAPGAGAQISPPPEAKPLPLPARRTDKPPEEGGR